MKLINNIRKIAFILALAAPVSLYAQKSKQSGPPKVLILKFHNAGGGGRIDFFHTTGPDIIAEKILELKKFTFIPDEKTEKAIAKLKLNKDQIHEKKYAFGIAELTDADIVITGEYEIKGSNYVITINVYNMADEKKDFKKTASGSVKSSVFGGMENLASDVARELSKTSAGTTAVAEKKRKYSGFTRFNPVVNLSGVYATDLGFLTNFGFQGAGFQVNWQPPPMAKFLHTYYEFQGLNVFSSQSLLPTWVYHFGILGLMWPFQVTSDFVFAPYVMSGMFLVTEGPVVVMDGPMGKAGVSMRFYFGDAVGFVVDTALSARLDRIGSTESIMFMNINLGVSYRIK